MPCIVRKCVLSVGNVYRGLGNKFISHTAGSPDEPTHGQIISFSIKSYSSFRSNKKKIQLRKRYNAATES